MGDGGELSGGGVLGDVGVNGRWGRVGLYIDLCDRKPFGSDLNDRATDTGDFTVC